MKIFIDAGHNHSGADSGAVGYGGLREQDVTFAIADALKRRFLSHGDEVKLSRQSLTDNLGTSVTESLLTRSRMSNEWGAELFLSIHCNSGGGTGTETLVYSAAGTAAEYARRILDAITSRLDLSSRGVKARPELSVLRRTVAPAVLIETAFLDRESDAALLSGRPQEFAEAIFRGVTGEEAEDMPVITEIDAIVEEYVRRGSCSTPRG